MRARPSVNVIRSTAMPAGQQGIAVMRRTTRSRGAAIGLIMATAVALAIQPHTAHAAPGDITTVAGNGIQDTTGDGGAPTSAALYSPYGIVASGSGFFVSQNGRDAQSSRVRMVAGGTITTVAGGVDPPLADGGPATQAALAAPQDVVRAANGDIYVTDLVHQRVRKVSAATGVMTTIAGSTVCTGRSTPAGAPPPETVAPPRPRS